MSTRSDEERAASRAEARRRARLAARGELPEDEDAALGDPEPEPRRGFLQRLFPPAPPLPNRPDPLRGFDGDAPLRPVRERVFLLRSNLLAWIIPGVIAFVGYMASRFYGAGLLGLLGTFVLFGSLIAAGWFGWQRPALFGTAASLLAYLLTLILVVFQLGQAGIGVDEIGPGQIVLELVQGLLYQAGLGFLGGWYGGYLRRRQTQLSADVKRRRR